MDKSANPQDSEDYWCNSAHKAFSFDEDNDTVDANTIPTTNWDVLNDECNPARTINLTVTTIVSEDVLKCLLQEQCITDECVIPKGISAEEELKILRRQIQTTLYNPSPETTAQKLVLGKNPPLELFKSIDEKEKLLDSIYQLGGGDGVITILLFLKRTLSREKFFEILSKRSQALQQYLSFLKSHKDTEAEALELLTFFGRHQEALTMQFTAALGLDDIESRKIKLKELLGTYGNNAFNVHTVYLQKIQSAIKLLELVEKDRRVLDNTVDLNSTPIEVLYACCRKNSNWNEPNLTSSISPYRLCSDQNISEAQFEWTALNERTISQAYADLKSIFERVPTWHPIKQKQFHINISLETAILRLHFLKAPQSVLYMFLSQMNNSSEKIDISRRVNSTKAEIDALAGLKDTTELNQLLERLPDRSEEKFYCEKMLKQLQSKRWSTDNIKIKL